MKECVFRRLQNLCLNCQNRLHSTRCSGFGSLMNIDKLIHGYKIVNPQPCFGSLMNIDKLIPIFDIDVKAQSFGSLMNIDKLIQQG